MSVTGFDHVALPTSDAERLLRFYKQLGFTIEGEAEWRAGIRPVYAIRCGEHNKINVHPENFWPSTTSPLEQLRGPTATPGCGDICVVWDGGIDVLLARLEELGIPVISGPGWRRGGRAPGVSVYIRDPDDNLLEFMSYDAGDLARCPDPGM